MPPLRPAGSLRLRRGEGAKLVTGPRALGLSKGLDERRAGCQQVRHEAPDRLQRHARILRTEDGIGERPADLHRRREAHEARLVHLRDQDQIERIRSDVDRPRTRDRDLV